MEYCTHIEISEGIRLDLFTETCFRVRISRLGEERFPVHYEIPFAVGHTQAWATVNYTADDRSDSTMVAVRTAKLCIYVRKNTGRFMVYSLDGVRLYPVEAPKFGMFANHCVVFDAASHFNEYSACSRYCHWFYNPETGLYDIPLAEDKLFDTYFLWGENYKDCYRQYNELVGAEPMLLKKAYGYTQTQHISAQGTQKKLMSVAKELRARDIPCDTLIIDYEWGDGSDDGKELPWGSRLDWSSEYRKPLSPEDMIAQLNKLHYDVMVIHHSIPAYEGRNDEDWVCAEYDSNLWWGKMHGLMDAGVCGTWQDTRKTDVTDARIYAGLQAYYGKRRRAAFLCNYDLFYEMSWTKDQMLLPVHQRVGGRRTPYRWTGDMAFKRWEDLAFQIKAITNEHAALKGISYLTNDCMRLATREISVRSCQFLCFNSVLRSHHPKPWDTSDDPDLLAESMAIGKEKTAEKEATVEAKEDRVQEAILRKFIKLRYRLFPYLYTLARETYQSGLPMTRPLMIEFEDDPDCNQNQNPYEYMLGSRMLVAPVWHGGDTLQVYLPAGADWVDFFTGETYGGGREITVDISNLEYFPLFVRAGSVIPFGAERDWLDETNKTLTLVVFGEGEDVFELYEDDGVSLGYQSGEYAVTKIKSKAQNGNVTVTVGAAEGNYNGMPQAREIAVYYRGRIEKKTVKSNQTVEYFL